MHCTSFFFVSDPATARRDKDIAAKHHSFQSAMILSVLSQAEIAIQGFLKQYINILKWNIKAREYPKLVQKVLKQQLISLKFTTFLTWLLRTFRLVENKTNQMNR